MPRVLDYKRAYGGASRLSALYLGANRLARTRMNLFTNPVPASTSGFVAQGSTITFDQGGVHVLCTADGVTDRGVNLAAGHANKALGVTYTISVDVKGIVTDNWRISIQGNWVASAQTSTYTNVPAGQTKRLTWTFTTTGSALTGAAIYLLRNTNTIASEAIVSRVLIEAAPAPARAYFDGTTARAEWTGAASASTSTLWDA